MAEFGTIVFDKLIYDLCKNGWRPDLRGPETEPMVLKNYFGVKDSTLGEVDSSVLKEPIEVVKDMKPNTQYLDFMDNRIDNFKNALLLLFLVSARNEIASRESTRKPVLERFRKEIVNLSEQIKEAEVSGQSEDVIKKLKEKRLIFRKVRYKILTGQDSALPISVTINFTDSLIHPDGETLDPKPLTKEELEEKKANIDLEPEEVKLILDEVKELLQGESLDGNAFNLKSAFGISPDNVFVNDEPANSVIPGFDDNTYALYCGD